MMGHFFLILGVGLLVQVSYLAQTLSAECIRSFSAFAYEGPPPREENQRVVPPLPPWERIALPMQPVSEGKNYIWHIYDTMTVGESEALWVSVVSDRFASLPAEVALFDPETGGWEWILTNAHRVEYAPWDIWVMNDGTAWIQAAAPNSIVFALFDPQTRAFELDSPVFQIPVQDGQDIYYDFDVVSDGHNFWVFVRDDALYKLDPETTETTRMIDLPDQEITNTAAAPDGSIYFRYYRWQGEAGSRIGSFRLNVFSPQTNEIERVEIPLEDAPDYNGIEVDSSGQLWLGAIAYRDTAMKWELLHSDFTPYFRHFGDYLWTLPYLETVTSDNRLWYVRSMDTGGLIDGATWFDPLTDVGCQFTNQDVFRIVEDSSGNVWLSASGTIYKLQN